MDSITLPISVDNVDIIIDFVTNKLNDKNINSKIIKDIEISLDELLSNILNYGYKDKKGDIKLDLDILDKEIVIYIIDSGIPYNPLNKDDPKLEGDIKTRPIGGLGIYITTKLMDEITYNRINNKNKLVIKKLLNKRSNNMKQEELIKKAKHCKTIDEIMSLAKENNIEITQKEAELAFNKTHQKNGELSDNELNDVAGGTGGCSGTASVTFENKVNFREANDNNYLYQVGQAVKFVEDVKGRITEDKIIDVVINSRSWAHSDINKYIDMYTVKGAGVSSSIRYSRNHFVKQ